jgi:hypothetical protein
MEEGSKRLRVTVSEDTESDVHILTIRGRKTKALHRN